MTRLELRTRILEALDESPTDPHFWSLSEMDGVIDEGQEILAEELFHVHRQVVVPFRPGAFYYHTQSLAPDVMSVFRIWDQSNQKRLTCVTLSELDMRHERWVDTQGQPDVWCPISWDLFLIWPGESSGGGLMKIDYLAWPKSLDDDSEEPELSVADHESLVLYGVYEGLLKLWDLDKAVAMFVKFLERIPKGKARSGRILHDQASVSRTPGLGAHRSGVRA